MFHRQFIAAVLAAAVAVTGMTAAPARADNDAAKVIAGVAALAVLGAAMSDARHRDRPKVIYRSPPAYGHNKHYTKQRHHKARDRYERRDNRWNRHNNRGGVVPHARGRVALPHACIVRNTGGRAVYSARCLERYGYR